MRHETVFERLPAEPTREVSDSGDRSIDMIGPRLQLSPPDESERRTRSDDGAFAEDVWSRSFQSVARCAYWVHL